MIETIFLTSSNQFSLNLDCSLCTLHSCLYSSTSVQAPSICQLPLVFLPLSICPLSVFKRLSLFLSINPKYISFTLIPQLPSLSLSLSLSTSPLSPRALSLFISVFESLCLSIIPKSLSFPLSPQLPPLSLSPSPTPFHREGLMHRLLHCLVIRRVR